MKDSKAFVMMIMTMIIAKFLNVCDTFSLISDFMYVAIHCSVLRRYREEVCSKGLAVEEVAGTVCSVYSVLCVSV